MMPGLIRQRLVRAHSATAVPPGVSPPHPAAAATMHRLVGEEATVGARSHPTPLLVFLIGLVTVSSLHVAPALAHSPQHDHAHVGHAREHASHDHHPPTSGDFGQCGTSSRHGDELALSAQCVTPKKIVTGALWRGLSVPAAAYLASLATALASLAGLLFLPLPTAVSDAAAAALLAFAAGALLADTTLHLLPHAYERAPRVAGFAVLAGIALFFALDRVLAAASLHQSHGHGHARSHAHGERNPQEDATELLEDRSPVKVANGAADVLPPLPHLPHAEPAAAATSAAYMNLAADALHNFCDGLSVGAAFKVSPAAGLSTTLGVVLHEVPQELGDYLLLRRGGFSRAGALVANLSCALAAVAGTAAALHLGDLFEGAADVILPFCAGGLLYMTIGAVLPQIAEAVTSTGSLESGPTKTLVRAAAAAFCGAAGIAVVQMIEFAAHGEDGHVH
jgi:zinc and cadmium transporter